MRIQKDSSPLYRESELRGASLQENFFEIKTEGKRGETWS